MGKLFMFRIYSCIFKQNLLSNKFLSRNKLVKKYHLGKSNSVRKLHKKERVSHLGISFRDSKKRCRDCATNINCLYVWNNGTFKKKERKKDFMRYGQVCGSMVFSEIERNVEWTTLSLTTASDFYV